MCKTFILLSLLISTSLQLRRFDPDSSAIESESVRKNRFSPYNGGVNPEEQENNSEIGGNPEGQNLNENIGVHPEEQEPAHEVAENGPFLPGSREDDPLASLQSSRQLDREIEKPLTHKSSKFTNQLGIKYAGVNHSDTYVTNNFYNENQEGIDMIVKYMWKRIYDLHDQIEALPIGIKKSPLLSDKDHAKKKALVITMDEKPTLTVDTKN